MRRSTTKAISPTTACQCRSRRLHRRRAGPGRLHGRFAEAVRLGRGGSDSVPRTRRRQPRVDGFEHATPGRAAARYRSAARRHRPGRQVARDSRAVIVAEEAGKVASVTGNQIIITEDGKLPEGRKKIKHDPEDGIHVYEVRKFMRSNAATCINQKILVKKGDTSRRARSSPTVRARAAANWPSAATCSSRSCRGTATTSRTPS